MDAPRRPIAWMNGRYPTSLFKTVLALGVFWSTASALSEAGLRDKRANEFALIGGSTPGAVEMLPKWSSATDDPDIAGGDLTPPPPLDGELPSSSLLPSAFSEVTSEPVSTASIPTSIEEEPALIPAGPAGLIGALTLLLLAPLFANRRLRRRIMG